MFWPVDFVLGDWHVVQLCSDLEIELTTALFNVNPIRMGRLSIYVSAITFSFLVVRKILHDVPEFS